MGRWGPMGRGMGMSEGGRRLPPAPEGAPSPSRRRLLRAAVVMDASARECRRSPEPVSAEIAASGGRHGSSWMLQHENAEGVPGPSRWKLLRAAVVMDASARECRRSPEPISAEVAASGGRHGSSWMLQHENAEGAPGPSRRKLLQGGSGGRFQGGSGLAAPEPPSVESFRL